MIDEWSLKTHIKNSRFARAHGRFVVPAILIHGQYICRSSTISIEAESILQNVQAKTFKFIQTLYMSPNFNALADFYSGQDLNLMTFTEDLI